MLIDPPSTFHNCGSSSRLHRRSQRPTRVSRGSTSGGSLKSWSTYAAHNAGSARRIASESDLMVRNFSISNGTPSAPTRF